MKNKIIIGFGVAALAVIALVLFVDFEDKAESPKETVAVANATGDLNVSVTYGRPSVRGRVIFGTAAENALQPHGKYWRLGANEATEITFSKDVIFAGAPVKAGTYRMYAVPGAETFQIGLNSELGQWGYDEPKYDKDVLKVTVPVTKPASPVEQLTINMDQSVDGIVIVMAWANAQLQIQVDPAPIAE